MRVGKQFVGNSFEEHLDIHVPDNRLNFAKRLFQFLIQPLLYDCVALVNRISLYPTPGRICENCRQEPFEELSPVRPT